MKSFITVSVDIPVWAIYRQQNLQNATTKNREIFEGEVSVEISRAQVYISKALRAKSDSDLEEYQLWAAMALELLAKASLAGKHPALVADPSHAESLFAACGYPISPDVKTITAKTLYQRLSHVSPNVDHRVQRFCEQLSLR